MDMPFETIISAIQSHTDDGARTVSESDDYNIPANLLSVFDENNSQKHCLKSVSRHRVFVRSKRVSENVRNGYDPDVGLIPKKNKWLKDMKRSQQCSFKDQSLMDELLEQVDNLTENASLLVPEKVMCYMKRAESDPDPYFLGGYNWYYTGGSLKYLSSVTGNLLLYTSGEKRQFLRVASVNSEPYFHVNTATVKKGIPSGKSEIFQIVGTEVDNEVIVGTRQRNTCSIFPVRDSTNCEECITCKSDVPFTGLDLNSTDCRFCTIDVNGGIALWDIPERRLIRRNNDSDPSTKWTNIHYSLDHRSVTIATSPSALNFLDSRAKRIVESLSTEQDLRMFSNKECMSFVLSSTQKPHCIYIATSATILLADKRNLKLPLHRWVHCLKTPPICGSIVNLKHNVEVACFASSNPGSVILAQSAEEMAYPLLEAPSLADSLLAYQSEGFGLDPTLEPRVLHSFVGLTCLPHNKSKKFDLLTHTSAADVLSQTVARKLTNNMHLEDLSSLAEHSNKLNLTGEVDMTYIYEGLGNNSLNINKKSTSNIALQPWQRTSEQLLSYRDVLSTIILDIWDVEIKEESTIVNETSNQDIPTDAKVKTWLAGESYLNRLA